MPSFKNQEPMIELPKLISLDIIDLNKRLRKRKNKIGSNLWDLLPDDVMPNIVKYKVKMDFDSKWDYNLIVSKYNSLYDYNTLNQIAISIIDDNNWEYRKYLKEKMRGKAFSDDYYDEFCRERLFEFVIFKLQEKGDLNYLKYFNEYTKKEVVLKRFKVGKTYYKTFKNIDTKETIKIPFTITKRDDVITIGIECKGHFTANIDGTDINVRLTINYEEDKKRKDDDNLYINEYTELTFCKNRDFERYLKYNNLKIIRYRMNA